MAYDELLREERIRPHSVSSDDIAARLVIAQARLGDAATERLSADGRFVLAYDAVRPAAEAVMAAEGYRPVGGAGHHETVFAFLRLAVGGRWATPAVEFEQARVKCNTAEYDQWGLITQTEADRLLSVARQFVNDVGGWIAASGDQGSSPSNEE